MEVTNSKMNILLELEKPVSQIYSSLLIMFIISIIVIIVGLRVRKLDPSKKTPVWLVPFIMIVDLINKLCKENFGKRWKSYAAFLLTLSIYLLFANFAGVAGLSTPTSYIVINASLGLIAFAVIQFTGLRSLGLKKYAKSFFDPIPFMFPINLMSELTLPISLTLRLTGNVIAGSIIGTIIHGMAGINGWLIIVAIPATIIVNLIFDLFSGAIQVLVFVLLTTIFANMKVDPKDLTEEENNSKEQLLENN